LSANPAISLFSLEGIRVRLDPLRPEHVPLLWEIAKDHLEDLFQWIPYRLCSLEDFQEFNRQVLEEQERGMTIPFATFERHSNQIVGTTRFMNMDLANRKVEIGSTWIAPRWQRTVVNTEAKYLMLCQAFETWKCMRVELKTDALNQRSREAILRLGDQVGRDRPAAEAFVEACWLWHRDLLCGLAGGAPRLALFGPAAAKAGGARSLDQVLGALRDCREAWFALQGSVSPRLSVEVLLGRLTGKAA